MGKIIAIANQKGGVGKTTTALNIAAGLVKVGKKVLLVDLDPQANLTDYLAHVEDGKPTIADLMMAAVNGQQVDASAAIRVNAEGIHYIPANILLSGADLFLASAFCREKVLSKILHSYSVQDYDYMLIDCLPSLGIMLTNALTASDQLLIPVQAQKFALDGLQQLQRVYSMVKDNLNPNMTIVGVLLTMYDNTAMAKAVAEALESQFPGLVFGTTISRLVEATNSTYEQRSLIATPNSRLGVQYMQLAHELLRRQGHGQ